jgi:hypothetical protein
LLRRLAVLSLALFAVGSAVAAPPPRPLPERYADLLGRDVRASKRGILGESLRLTEPQASAFWPIYRTYEDEAAVVDARRVALVRELVTTWGTLGDERSRAIADEWFAIQKERIAVLERAHARVRNALGAKVAGRFVQVEHALNLLVDVSLAEESPLLE